MVLDDRHLVNTAQLHKEGWHGLSEFQIQLSKLRGLTRLGVRRQLSSVHCAEPSGDGFLAFEFASEEDRLNGAVLAMAGVWPTWFFEATRWLLLMEYLDEVLAVVERIPQPAQQQVLETARVVDLPMSDRVKIMIHCGQLEEAKLFMEPASGKRDGNPWNDVLVRWYWKAGRIGYTHDAFLLHFRSATAPASIRLMFLKSSLRIGFPNAPLFVAADWVRAGDGNKEARDTLLELESEINACPALIVRWLCKKMVQSVKRMA